MILVILFCLWFIIPPILAAREMWLKVKKVKLIVRALVAVVCVGLFVGCSKPQTAPEDRLAARAFLYGCTLSWAESTNGETKEQFKLRMAQQALVASPNDCTTPIWLEAIRQCQEH